MHNATANVMPADEKSTSARFDSFDPSVIWVGSPPIAEATQVAWFIQNPGVRPPQPELLLVCDGLSEPIAEMGPHWPPVVAPRPPAKARRLERVAMKATDPAPAMSARRARLDGSFPLVLSAQSPPHPHPQSLGEFCGVAGWSVIWNASDSRCSSS